MNRNKESKLAVMYKIKTNWILMLFIICVVVTFKVQQCTLVKLLKSRWWNSTFFPCLSPSFLFPFHPLSFFSPPHPLLRRQAS